MESSWVSALAKKEITTTTLLEGYGAGLACIRIHAEEDGNEDKLLLFIPRGTSFAYLITPRRA